jgi:hypothetical protein
MRSSRILNWAEICISEEPAQQKFESPPPATSMDTGFPQKLLTFFGKVRRRESFEIDMFRICYLQWLKAMVRPAKKPNNASVKT